MVTEASVEEADVDEPDDPRPPTPWRFGWWQTVALILVVAFIAGVGGWMIGRPTDPSFNDADAGFLVDMTDHHLGAITLGFAYLDNSNDEIVRSLAREVVRYQSQEIGSMNSLLGQAGDPESAHGPIAMRWMGEPIARAAMPGLVTRAEYDELAAAAGLEADDIFTRLMIDHHAAGVGMAEAEIELGDNATVIRLARSIATQQRDEIADYNHRREQLGLSPVEPDFDLHGH